MSRDLEVPKCWSKVTLGDVATEYSARVDNPAESEYERFVGSNHIGRFELTVSNWGSTSEVTSAMKVFQPGDYLVVRRSLYASDFRERAARANFEGVCSGDILTIRERDNVLAPGFLSAVLNTPEIWAYIVAHATGSITRRIKWRELREYEFALPPFEEQQRVAKALLSGVGAVDAAENLLRSAETLADAFALSALGIEGGTYGGGRLLSQLESRSKWPLFRVGELGRAGAQIAQVGPFGSSLASRHYTESGVMVLKVLNVGQHGFVDGDNPVYIEADYAETLQRYSVNSEDVLIVAQGFTSGRVAIVRESDPPGVISQHLLRVRVDTERVRQRWLWMFCMSALFREQLTPVIHKTTRPGVNTADVLALVLPVPPVEAQDDLIAEFEQVWEATRLCQQRHERAKSFVQILASAGLSEHAS